MNAIVYTSNTGHTAEYAEMLGRKTGLPVYEFKDAVKKFNKNTRIIYLGWLFANNIKEYKKAKKAFNVVAVCAVGLCDTGSAVDEVRKLNGISTEVPLFTIQGGMEKDKLNGFYKFIIKMLIKAVESKKNKTSDDERMLYLLKNDKNYVCEENITSFTEWFGEYNKNAEKNKNFLA